ncbi:N-acetylmuramoyl-L-alanine amidase [Lacinutrix sp. 5H-3-7-4]|uniref:N-acetylmuramoyl-L-alanine amidase family protein n=1 Tax=Lacinutrix sp. (strain 5H-3-7-4) TaxID=983544 RepID=UPI00020A3E2D|nr:N-acetylmuramoyl-L-alanine amidase [Lacinutrix sp. 5H-3-7-4]
MINLLFSKIYKTTVKALKMSYNIMQTQLKTVFVFFIIVLTVSVFSTVDAQSNKGKFVVVLDAGHGGKDPGKHSQYGYRESDIALKIVKKVGAALEKNKDIKVIYTRKTDVFLELRERAAIANRADADLFVSIHCNAHNSQAYGTETFVLGVANTKRNLEIAKKENEVIFLEDNHEEHYAGFDPDSPESFIGLSLMQEEYTDQSIMLARLVENNFRDKSKRKSRGVKQASLWVMHNTYMPSVLIETGFVTNKSEGAYLNSSKGQSNIATSIENAILKYKNNLDLNISVVDMPLETIEEEDISTEEKIINNTVFKVQIAASSKKLEPKPYNFKGLNPVSREKEDKLYKYFYGYSSDINKIQLLQKEARKKGFNSAYIVAYKDGKRISLEKALNEGAK